MPSLNESIISRKQLRGLFGKRSKSAADAPQAAAGSGQEYWRSLNELAQTPEFDEMLQREFASVAADAIEPTSRRSFLKFMGASLALAGIGITSCRWPEEKIAPFANRQDGYLMGVPVQFATALDIGGFATGLLATSYDGRPVKLEGNPLHRGSQGAASALHQASLLDLYDANRAKGLLRRLEPGQAPAPSNFVEFNASLGPLFANYREQQGSRMAVLCEANSSPTRARLQREWQAAMPLAQWYEYEPLNWDSVREGTRMAFGLPLRPQYDLTAAKVIVSFGCDFLLQHPDSLRLARDWASGRTGLGGRMNRTYVIESSFSITGANADHRLQVKPSGLESALFAMGRQLNEQLGLGLPTSVFADAGVEFANAEGAGKAWQTLMQDLTEQQGSAVIIAGPQCGPEAQALAAVLNSALGNVGSTLSYTAEEHPQRLPHSQALAELTGRLKQNELDTLLIIGGNPVFDAPADLEFSKALVNARHTVHLSLYDNETSQICQWLLPRAHFLEEWGDARGYDGSYSVVQPLIEPLYGGMSPQELIGLALTGNLVKSHDLVRETFTALNSAADSEAAWRETLHDGVLKDSAAAPAMPSGYRAGELRPLGASTSADFELVFATDYSVYDGRFANNGWLQETPDPLSKLTWDNACLISLADAEKMGVKHEDVVELEANGVKVTLPVYVLPGQPKGVVTASLGYGRSKAGDIGDGVGSNLYPLRHSSQLHWTPVNLSKTGATYQLATTQDHHLIDTRGFVERANRAPLIVREANLEFFNEHPDFAQLMLHTPGDVSRWADWKYPIADNVEQGQLKTHRWGMSIDLSACIGCSACIVACTAENNIPVVGKDRVRRGREMHWLRVDRYFRGDAAAPRVSLLPMTCQQCELAPCEQVCPVNATTHSDEGLNDMVYNRCIGTRYCSNNCPFKVRRFNYFNYQKSLTETQKLVHNPEVTIRSRGVMEKCTYCVQRIQTHKIKARSEKSELQDGDIKTACQQTCPTGAIVFGDLNDAASQVFDLRFGHLSDRVYTQLDELQLRPRTSYLAGLWNPAPGTEEFDAPAPTLFEHHGHEAEHAAPGHGESGHADDEHAESGEHMMEEAAPAGH